MLNRNIFLQKYFCRLHECSLHQITTELLLVSVVKHSTNLLHMGKANQPTHCFLGGGSSFHFPVAATYVDGKIWYWRNTSCAMGDYF